MNFPDHLKYTDHDEWIAPVKDGKAKSGISDFAQKELGDIAFVEMPEVGAEFAKGDVYGTIESVKAAADLYMPVSGKISAVNEDLVNNENWEVVNSDPYGAGWLIEIEVSDAGELDGLKDAAAYGAEKS